MIVETQKGRVAVILTLMILLCQSVPAQTIRNGEDLLRAMRERYHGTRFRTVTFTQRTINIAPDGSRKETIWQEALNAPGKLNIKFEPVDSGNGLLFINDSIFVFENGAVRVARPLVHFLLLLDGDVFHQPVEVSIRKLRGLKYDLDVLDETEWQGRRTYIVGAKKGDERSKQFWIDRERLVLVRTLEMTAQKPPVLSEVRMSKHIQIGGGWLETEVLFLHDGKIRTEEHYSDVKPNVDLDDRLYNPANWNTARWR